MNDPYRTAPQKSYFSVTFRSQLNIGVYREMSHTYLLRALDAPDAVQEGERLMRESGHRVFSLEDVHASAQSESKSHE